MDVDDELKDLLTKKADEMRLPAEIPQPVLRRARRRRVVNAVVAGGLAVGVASIAFVGVRAAMRPSAMIPANPSPSLSPSMAPSPAAWRGIWPTATLEGGQALQEQVDRGEDVWLLDDFRVASRFAKQQLAWNRSYLIDSSDVPPPNPDDAGPMAITLTNCPPTALCKVTLTVTITVERLIRQDRTGAWFVTKVKGPREIVPPFRPGNTRGFPPTFIAIGPPSDPDSDPIGTLVLVDTATGQPIRRIISSVDLSEGGISSFSLSPYPQGGSVLYYGQSTSACTDEVRSVPVEGGVSKVVVDDGRLPVVTRDGRLIAYVRGGLLGCGSEDQSLVVRDLASGAESSWALGIPVGQGFSGLCELSWFPDARRITFGLCSEDGGDVFVLDTEGEQGIELKDARRMGASGKAYELIGYKSHEPGIAAIEDGEALVLLDPDTGAVTATLLDPAPTEIASAMFDATGTYLVYTTFDLRVFGWGGTGDPVEIARGYSQAVW
jgi:hypothetical protein